jgi:hypothetical protein
LPIWQDDFLSEMLQVFPAYDSLKARFASRAADWIEKVERLQGGMAALKMKSFSR